jgi:hypothetical protein
MSSCLVSTSAAAKKPDRPQTQAIGLRTYENFRLVTAAVPRRKRSPPGFGQARLLTVGACKRGGPDATPGRLNLLLGERPSTRTRVGVDEVMTRARRGMSAESRGLNLGRPPGASDREWLLLAIALSELCVAVLDPDLAPPEIVSDLLGPVDRFALRRSGDERGPSIHRDRRFHGHPLRVAVAPRLAGGNLALRARRQPSAPDDRFENHDLELSDDPNGDVAIVGSDGRS